MKKLMMLLSLIAIMATSAYAGEYYVLSEQVLQTINTNSGVSKLTVPGTAEKALVGISGDSGNSVYWRMTAMTGVGTSARGMSLVVGDGPIWFHGQNQMKSLNFGSCTTTGISVFAIYFKRN